MESYESETFVRIAGMLRSFSLVRQNLCTTTDRLIHVWYYWSLSQRIAPVTIHRSLWFLKLVFRQSFPCATTYRCDFYLKCKPHVTCFRCHKVDFLTVNDNMKSCLKNGARTAIVLFHVDHLRFGVFVLHFDEIAWLCTSEPINGLIGIWRGNFWMQ